MTTSLGRCSLFPRRELGVLLHPTSLFNREDVGTLGSQARAVVDWLERAGVTLWQILPLMPNGLYNSPYFSPSAFAGSPWLIDLELLAAAGNMAVQSGVPPDYFSATGQLWGNPIYDWGRMAEDGFSWWIDRLRRCVALNDIVRIDHFRALSACWEVPADAADARAGHWVPGPGQAFFDAVARRFPTMPFVAEDLGLLDHAVHVLRDRNGLFGMRIVQFGFDGLPDNVHRPDVFPDASIAYTGTHDNDTLAGWWGGLDRATRAEVAGYYQFGADDPIGRVVWSLIEAVVACRSRVAVIPLQDLLVLDGRSRMNDPAPFVGNWEWRLPPDGLSEDLALSLRQQRERYR